MDGAEDQGAPREDQEKAEEEEEVKMAKLILTPWEKICVRDSLHFNRKEILKLVKAQEGK